MTVADVEDEDEDEHNLLYVAVTRAKKQLILSPTLLDILQKAGVRNDVSLTCSTLSIIMRSAYTKLIMV